LQEGRPIQSQKKENCSAAALTSVERKREEHFRTIDLRRQQKIGIPPSSTAHDAEMRDLQIKSLARYINRKLLSQKTGGEGGILLPPLPANADEHYTSAIIPFILESYKRIRSSVPVSTVPLIRYISLENGITGISRGG
jgi:hypothetical protein